MYQGTCSRGYTLENPHASEHGVESHFASEPEGLVPTIDPFGAEYLRSSNVCERFQLPDSRRVSDSLRSPSLTRPEHS